MKTQQLYKDRHPLIEITDPSIRVVLDFLVEFRGLDYSKLQIAKNAGISRPTLYRVWPMLVKNGLIVPTRKFGNTQLYKANEQNEIVKFFVNLEKAVVKENLTQLEEARNPEE